MSDVRSLYGRGQEGIASMQFPIFAPDTQYTLTVTLDAGLTSPELEGGSESVTFNSSTGAYNGNYGQTYAVHLDVLSDGENYDESGNPPPGYPLSPAPNPVSAADDGYSIVAGETLTENVQNGVLANDIDGQYSALGTGATAEVAFGPFHGTVALNYDGSFSYAVNDSEKDTFSGRDLFRYVVHGVSGTSLMATVYVKVLNFKYVAEKTWVDDRVTPQSTLRDSQKVADDEAVVQARIKQKYHFDYMFVIPRNLLQDRMPGRTYGTSGFVIGVKGGYKGTDFSKLTVTLVPYAILYAEGGPVKIHFPAGPFHPQLNEEQIWDGPTSTKDHELWHTEGEPQWVQDKVKIRLNNQDPVAGIGFVEGFNREMAKIATDLGASNATADALYRQLLDKVQTALVPIQAGGPWHTTSTKQGAMFDIIIR